jgi:hypothetical protein
MGAKIFPEGCSQKITTEDTEERRAFEFRRLLACNVFDFVASKKLAANLMLSELVALCSGCRLNRVLALMCRREYLIKFRIAV